MVQELIYTSAPHGIRPGSSGFCTVARTAGLSPVLAAHLESLSGYRHLFPPQSEDASRNPVRFSHTTLRKGSTQLHVLSRVADAGLDYTKRSNMIAHHLVFSPEELPPSGPGWILAQPNLFVSQWNSPPTEFQKSRDIPRGEVQPGKCTHWEKLLGDPGWGGILAETAVRSRPVCLLFEPGMNVLPLIEESLALLPAPQRWKVSFNTYWGEQNTGSTCLWKCAVAQSPESVALTSVSGVLVIDLTKPRQSVPNSDSPFLELSRTGRMSPPIAFSSGKIAPAAVAPPVNIGTISAPPTPGPIEVPAIQGDSYDIVVEPPKRKRPRTGVWSKKYETSPTNAQKARREFRIFLTIMILTSLVIFTLLTLIGDELINSGRVRKSLTQSLSTLVRRSPSELGEKVPQNGEKPVGKTDEQNQDVNNGRKGDVQPEPENVSSKPPTKEPEPPEVEFPDMEMETSMEENTPQPPNPEGLFGIDGDSVRDEQAILEEEMRKQEAEERLEIRKEEMRKAFLSIPGHFELEEPKSKAFGGIDLKNQLREDFIPLSPFRSEVQMRWFALVKPRGWDYRLERLPQSFADDPVRWNLLAEQERTGKKLRLCTLTLDERGLEFQWDAGVAGAESNFEIVNKLPFSYLRVGLGPAFDLSMMKPEHRGTRESHEYAEKEGLLEDMFEAEENGEIGGFPREEREIRESPINPDWMNRNFRVQQEKEESEFSDFDFTKHTRFKDIGLFKAVGPPRMKPVQIMDKGGLSRPSAPEEVVKTVFSSDRWRIGLENIDVLESLRLEISIVPPQIGNVSAICSPTAVPWKKEISLSTDLTTVDSKPILIPISVELSVGELVFRDHSHEMKSEALAKARALAKQFKEEPEHVEELRKEHAMQDDLFQKIPQVRKQVILANLRFHYAVYLKGEKTEEMLLFTSRKELLPE